MAEKISRSFYAEEERIEESIGSLGRLNVEDDNAFSITFEGDALKDLRKLRDRLKGAKNEHDVVRIALELLALAEGKEVIIEGGGKRWRLKDLWQR